MVTKKNDMKQFLLLALLTPFFSISQTQIGGDIDGETVNDQSGKNTSLYLSSNSSKVTISSSLYNKKLV